MANVNKVGRRSRSGSPWTFAELQELGETPDSVLAFRNVRTIKEIVDMREHYRIALVTGPRPWTMPEVKLLGTMNDYEVELRVREVVPEDEGFKVSFDIPMGKGDGISDEVLFLCFSREYGPEDRTSDRLLYSIRWR